MAHLIIHRGIVNKKYKENLLKSFKQSFQKGYGIETDIHATKDHEFICFHDFTFNRIFKKKVSVKDMEYSKIKKISTQNKKPIPLLKDLLKKLKDTEKHYKRVQKLKEGFGGVSSPPPFSSKEAKMVVDDALKKYSKELRKLQGKVVKDWMDKAKSGVIDFFDLVRGFQSGNVRRSYPYETEFLMSVLTKDKIIDRFRKYFGGKKGKSGRRK